LRWRLFAEHQFAAPTRTDLSFPHLVHSSHVFRPGIAVQETDEVGMALGLKGARTVGGKGARVGLDVSLDAAVGRFPFARMAAAARAGTRWARNCSARSRRAAGTSDGPVPVQSLWYMGDPPHCAATAARRRWARRSGAAGRSWRTGCPRRGSPCSRMWRGRDRAMPSRPSRPLVAAGVGASFLDGLIRIDLARALRAPKGWRLEIYSDAIL